MGKEIKIGLAVIGTLLCVFGGVLAMRLKREHPASDETRIAAVKKDAKPAQGAKNKKSSRSEKHNKSEGGPSLNASFEKLASRSRLRTGQQPAKADRYGRPSPDENRPASDADEPGDALGSVEPAGVPDVRDSVYSDHAADSVDLRYPRDDAQNITDEGPEMTADERPLDDAPETIDRFAQPAARMAFSAEDRANAADETDLLPVDEVTDEPLADRPAADDQPVDEEPASFDELPIGETGPSLAGEPELEHVAARPERGDRYGDRFAAHQPRVALPADEPAIEEAEMTGDEQLDSAAEEPLGSTADSPASFESGSYTIAPSDNFWRISQKVYGTGAYYKALEEHNRRQFGAGQAISVGDVISTPPLATLRREYPQLVPRSQAAAPRASTAAARSQTRGGQTYTVAEGDTLFDIARSELGKASRWAEIYELNRDQLGQDFNHLSPGMRLAMPPGGSSAAPIATRRARDDYRR